MLTDSGMLERGESDNIRVQVSSGSFDDKMMLDSRPGNGRNHHNGDAPYLATTDLPTSFNHNIHSSTPASKFSANRNSLDNNRYAGYQGHPACLADTSHLNNSLLSVEASRLEPAVPREFSSRREIVELLDSELLLDYLVQNGVLTLEDVESIHAEPDTSRQNLALLKHIEMRPTARQLFTNVLRQTGQHYLANLVDDSARIKVLSGSGTVHFRVAFKFNLFYYSYIHRYC